MGRLREQMKGDLELRGLSQNTQEIYLNQVRDFSRHFNRSPLHMGEMSMPCKNVWFSATRKCPVLTSVKHALIKVFIPWMFR